MSIAIRPATGGDVAAVDALLRRISARSEEATFVQRLCLDGDMVLMLVADDEESGALAGTVVFSRMSAAVGGKSIASLALAPLAVSPDYREAGVGEALVQAGLEHLRAAGAMLCFVLGEPKFYERFGFSADWARGFATPYAGDYLLAVPLQDGAMPCGERGPATHATAFAQLSGDW